MAAGGDRHPPEAHVPCAPVFGNSAPELACSGIGSTRYERFATGSLVSALWIAQPSPRRSPSACVDRLLRVELSPTTSAIGHRFDVVSRHPGKQAWRNGSNQPEAVVVVAGKVSQRQSSATSSKGPGGTADSLNIPPGDPAKKGNYCRRFSGNIPHRERRFSVSRQAVAYERASAYEPEGREFESLRARQ